MRVLMVSHEWEAEHPGGAQRSASALARGIAAVDGSEVTLASAVERLPARAPDGVLPARDGFADVLVESRTDAAFFTWTDPVHARNWARVLEEVDPDIVHLHHYFHVGIDLPLLVRRFAPRAGIVLTLHEYMAICLRSGQMVDGHDNLCLSSASRRCAECVGWSIDTVAARDDYVRRGLCDVDLFITPSRFARGRYLDWSDGGGDRHIRVIPNALDFEARTDPGERTGAARGLRLAFIGQHTPHKGLGVLLDAVQQVRAEAPTALERVDVYGDGSDRFSAEFHAELSAALRAGGPLVRSRGRYTQADLPAILDGVDAVVVPSTWWENSPVVIEEALARRVPVICADIGGMAEKVRDGVDGWHFQAGNAASLAEVVVRVARQRPTALMDMRRPTPIADVVALHLEAYAAAMAAAAPREGTSNA